MWALINRTPYAAERTWIRDKRGAHLWVVAVKATFDVAQNGALKLADKQMPPLLAAEYFGEPGKSSVRYEADLGPMKPATDVTLIGNAYAPKGKRAEVVAVSMRVASIHKILGVYGERIYYKGVLDIEPSSPVPFVERPIIYELAFGGMDVSDPDPGKHAVEKRNPLGRGFAVRPRNLIDKPAPCIVYPEGDMAKNSPAGFGPIASYWSPRLEYGGTYDANWEKTKKPLLPDDYDERAVLCAPADQQIGQYLRGGEPVELINLTREGILRFALPKIDLTFATYFGNRRQNHPGFLASAVIEPDKSRLLLSWQTVLAVNGSEIDYLDQTTIEEK
jgi:hypothetical protein